MCPARSSTPAANRSSSSSLLKKPIPIRSASRVGTVPRIAKVRFASSSGRGVGRPAPDAEDQDGRQPVRRGEDLDAVDPREAGGGRAGQPGRAFVDPLPAHVHREPGDAPGEADDRRPVLTRRVERGPSPLEDRRAEMDRPDPVGPQQPGLAGDAVDVRAEAPEVDRDRPERLAAVDRDERPSGMGQLRDPGDRQERTRRRRDVADPDEPGAGRDRRLERADRHARRRARRPGRPRRSSTPDRSRRVRSGARSTPRVGPGDDDPVAGSPVDQPGRQLEGVGRRVDQADRLGIGHAHRGHGRPRLVHPLEGLGEVLGRPPADGQLPLGELGHRPVDLGRDRAVRRGVEVDPGGGRRKGATHGGELLVVGQEGGHHGPL